MTRARSPLVVLGSLVFALLLCVAIVSAMPDQKTCDMVTEMLIDVVPGDALIIYIDQLPKEKKDRFFVGDMSGQDPLLVEAWELRKQQGDIGEKVEALLADQEQKKADRQAQLDQQQREAEIERRGLDLEFERIRMAYEGGYSPLTGQEVREKLLRIEIQKAQIGLALARQKRDMAAQNRGDLEANLSQIETLSEELGPIVDQLTAKSRELLEQKQSQACTWFGRWDWGSSNWKWSDTMADDSAIIASGLFFWIICGVISGLIAQEKGRNSSASRADCLTAD